MLRIVGAAIVLLLAVVFSAMLSGPTPPAGPWKIPVATLPRSNEAFASPDAQLPEKGDALASEMLAILLQSASQQHDAGCVMSFVAHAASFLTVPRFAAHTRDGWSIWELTCGDQQHVLATLARRIGDDGEPVSRLTITLAPDVSVSFPYRAAGSKVEVTAQTLASGRPEVLAVVALGLQSVDDLPFHAAEGAPDRIPFGCRFRFTDDGHSTEIPYWAALECDHHRHEVRRCFGDNGAPFEHAGIRLEPGIASEAQARIERLLPCE